MRITSKGQVTIPISIRRATGLEAGTDVDFLIEDGDVVVRRSNRRPTASEHLVERLKNAGGAFTMSTERS